MKLAVQIDPTDFIEINTFRTPKLYQEFIEGFLKFLAQKMVDRVHEVIRNQSYNWHPLSRTWVAFKKSWGLDPRIWRASGWIEDSIHYWYSRKNNCWMVGVNPRKQHRRYKRGGIAISKRSGVLIIDIIRKLEFGTQKTPARPLFTRVIAEVKKDVNSYYKEYLISKAA